MVATNPPYEEKPTYEELLKRAERCLQGLSKSYVGDAQVFARWILTDGKAMLENLTAAQARGTELINEVRDLKLQAEEDRRAAGLEAAMAADAAEFRND